MISLDLNTRANITLNNYILNSISLFKYTPDALYDYVTDKCNDNPLIYIKDDHPFVGRDAENFHDDIIEEIRLHFGTTLSESDKNIMQIILGSLSPKGFLEASPAKIAEMANTSTSKVRRLIDELQEYENRGIGAADAIDFIAFQLKRDDIYDEEYFSAFKNHLNSIGNDDFTFLSGTDMAAEQFVAYIEDCIKACEIYPLAGEAVIDIVPEGSIKFSGGKLQIHIDDHLADAVVFEPLCLTEGETGFSQKIKAYHDEFTELVSMLRARKVYMLKILNVICDVQTDYLSGETDYLNTLDQTMLAELTALSPATISRLLSDKYISTPRGILPFRGLLSKECCKGHSVSQVKFVIRNIEDFEKRSDNEISLLLRELGIKISRRTVNKYKNQILHCK